MEDWAWNVVNLVTGLALFGLALRFPFRRLDAKPEITWDIIGILSVGAFAAGADYVLRTALDWTLAFPTISSWIETLTHWPFWLLLAGNLIVGDFIAYWGHRMLHTSMFWHTHAWHHASKYLYWASGLRGSPIHVLIIFAPSYLSYLLVPSPDTGMAGTLVVIIGILLQHFTHSNLRIPFSRQLERVLVTPRYHFVHHSADLTRGNSNFGNTFTVWDRMFGTHIDPDTVPANDSLGLSYKASHWLMLLGLPARTEDAAAATTLARE